jgi:hypothetical protein
VIRTLLLLGAAAASLLAPTAALATSSATLPGYGPAGTPSAQERQTAAKQPIVQTFYRGETIRTFDFGPIRLKPGNKVAPIWTFTNGAAGQRAVIDTVPGQKTYTPLWKVSRVTWAAGKTPRRLTSADAVRTAAKRGDVTVRTTSAIVNGPVLGLGQKRITGSSAGRDIHYYDLGRVKVAPGNAVVPLYAVTNGVEGQHNVAGDTIASGQTAYPPLWAITQVTWKASAEPRLLTSYAAIRSAAAAGDVTLTKTALVVNCPLV